MKTFLFALLFVGSFAHADKIQVSCKDTLQYCEGSLCQWKRMGNERIYDVELKVGPLGEAVGVWLGSLERKIGSKYKQTLSIAQIRGASPLWSHALETTVEVNGAKITTKGEYIISTQYENSETKEGFLSECSLAVPKGVATVLCNQ